MKNTKKKKKKKKYKKKKKNNTVEMKKKGTEDEQKGRRRKNEGRRRKKKRMTPRGILPRSEGDPRSQSIIIKNLIFKISWERNYNKNYQRNGI